MKTISLLALLIAFCSAGLYGQSGPYVPTNTVTISEVQCYDLQNGTALVEVSITGRGTGDLSGGSVLVSGNAIPSGSHWTSLSGTRPVGGPGSGTVVLTAAFPFSPSPTSGAEFTDFEFNLSGVVVIGQLTKSKENSSFKTFSYR